MKVYKIFLEEKHAGRTYLCPCTGNGIAVYVCTQTKPPTTKTKTATKAPHGAFTAFQERENAESFIYAWGSILVYFTTAFRKASLWEVEAVKSVQENLKLSGISLCGTCEARDRILTLIKQVGNTTRILEQNTRSYDAENDELSLSSLLKNSGPFSIPEGTVFVDSFIPTKRVRFVTERQDDSSVNLIYYQPTDVFVQGDRDV